MSDKMTLTPSKPSDSKVVSDEVIGVEIHSEKVLAWREQAFRRMGYTDFVADFLASTRIDLHEMDKLLKAGCAHDVAAQILMGTMWSGEDEQWRWTDESQYLDENDPANEVVTEDEDA